jgi:very-short-patch-repair endonuclease
MILEAKMISARKIRLELGYSKWGNFDNVISKLKHLIANGIERGEVIDSICEVVIGKGGVRKTKDYLLDSDAEKAIRKLTLSKKLGGLYSISNECAILSLLQKYCKNKNLFHDFQFRLDKYVYDFRCENILIEFDEAGHMAKKQSVIDKLKDNIATENGYKILRFHITSDIIDMIQAIEINIGNKTTIECNCGYIATFDRDKFICPDCGREYGQSPSGS